MEGRRRGRERNAKQATFDAFCLLLTLPLSLLFQTALFICKIKYHYHNHDYYYYYFHILIRRQKAFVLNVKREDSPDRTFYCHHVRLTTNFCLSEASVGGFWDSKTGEILSREGWFQNAIFFPGGKLFEVHHWIWLQTGFFNSSSSSILYMHTTWVAA